jgi:urea transport system substrate-binding protein
MSDLVDLTGPTGSTGPTGPTGPSQSPSDVILQIYDPIYNQMYNQMYNPMHDNLYDQMYNGLFNGLFNSMYNQMYNQIYNQLNDNQNIYIGLIHSLTGVMADSEIPVRNATLLAIESINNIHNTKVVPIQKDCASDPLLFAQYAEELITKYNVKALFGCWTSSSRKAVLPVLEKYNIPLFYPVQYEGCEKSPFVFYLGATSNQQIIPAIDWLVSNNRLNFYLLGSDYIFPRKANTIIKKQLEHLNRKTVAEQYVDLDYEGDFSDIIADIISKQPDTLINTLNGSENVTFFQELSKVRNLLPSEFKVMSFSIAEPEVKKIGVQHILGDYTCWNYYQTIDTVQNKKFVSLYKIVYGQDKNVDDPTQAAYSSVFLWYKMITLANTTNLDDIRKVSTSVNFNSPQGQMYFFDNQHIINDAVIGEIRSDELIYEVERVSNIEPDPCLKSYPWASDICDGPDCETH